jgi:hypothetical protein
MPNDDFDALIHRGMGGRSLRHRRTVPARKEAGTMAPPLNDLPNSPLMMKLLGVALLVILVVFVVALLLN